MKVIKVIYYIYTTQCAKFVLGHIQVKTVYVQNTPGNFYS